MSQNKTKFVIIMVISVYLLITVNCLSSQEPKLVQNANPRIINQNDYSSIIIDTRETGILYIDNVMIGKVNKGKNIVTDLTLGKHDFTVKFKDNEEKYSTEIKKNFSNFLKFYYTNYNIEPKIVDYSNEELTKKLYIILNQAYELLGRAPNSKVIVKNKSFTLDCVGTVSAIFYAADIDLQKMYLPYSGATGVKRLFQLLQSNTTLNSSRLPAVGDLVFWDDTYDHNNDGIFGNDPLTHVGVVTKADDDGTIHYVHQHIVYGVIVEKMNLYMPTERYDSSGKEINSPMHAMSNNNLKNGLPYLSGELWYSNGGVLKFTEK